MKGRARGGFGSSNLLGRLPDLCPQLIASGAGFGRIGEQAGRGIFLGQGSQCGVQSIVGEPVALGGHQQEFAIRGGEEVQQLAVTLLRGNVGVDQNDAQAQRGALVEIRLDEFGPLLGNLARNLGVAVAGKIGENQLGARFSGPANLEEVDAAGAAGSGTGARHLVSDQRIDDARLADVGPAEKSDLRQAGSGKLGGVGGRRQKPGENPHTQVCNEERQIGKLGTS